jgi:alpha-1,6-mannosyltransferase
MAMANLNSDRTNRRNYHPVHAGIVGLGLLSGVVYLFNFKLCRIMPESLCKADIHLFLYLFFFLVMIYFMGIYLIFNQLSQAGRSRSLVVIIIFFAVFFRAVLIPTNPKPLSNDIYRYIWDGRVQQTGINPYLYPPSSAELVSLRDDKIYPYINRKDYPTIYPAGAQIFFRVSHALVGGSIFGFKGLMVFFDVTTVLILLALLRSYGFEETRIFIYAWNPLVIFEIGYSGHLEGLTIFLVVLAFYLNAKKRKTSAVITLAFSSATKLYPALMLPALLNSGERIKGGAVFLGSFLVLYLPFLTAGNKITGYLPIYFKNPYESFNLGLKYLILRLFPGWDYLVISKIFMLVLTASGIFFFFKEKQKEQHLRCAYVLFGLLIILMPSALQPWYVIVLTPFLTFFPSGAWLMFTGTVALSYIKYASPAGIMPNKVLFLEYLPLFTILPAGYIFKRYGPQHWVCTFFQENKTQRLMEVQKR